MSTATHGEQPTSLVAPLRRNPRAAQMLTRIWLAAQAVWGHKWTSTQGDLPIDDNGQLTVAGQVWANGLRGITERQVLDAFDRCARLGQEWPPNLPELLKAAAGVPEFEELNHELLTCDPAHRSAFARLVWSFIDGYQHRHARAEEAKRMRRHAYERGIEHLLRGGELPASPSGDLSHQHAPAGIPKTREARIARLEGLLGEDFHEEAANRILDGHVESNPRSSAA